MILRKAQVMIFDEPTAELGGSAAQLVIATLQALAADSMVMVVTHDPELIAVAQMRIKIDKGMVLLEA